ncbi:hypothetical protein Tco_0974448 [Tanacetum coccineum]|uniref:Uncharacterized protein n=1 Tax=Tanacetum coccineum TaxID=301880 RepID=A0ABQ5EBQ4_9ASTR
MIASSESRNSSTNMLRFSSNDMVHNHYLDKARRKTQERDMNSKTSVMPSARFQNTADGSKPKPRSTNHSTRRKLFAPCTSKDDSEPTHGLNVDIPNIHESKQTLDLSTEVPSIDTIVMTSMIELESLFGPFFDEYFNGVNQVVSKSFVVTTADASDKCQQQPYSISSTSALATTVTVDGNFKL